MREILTTHRPKSPVGSTFYVDRCRFVPGHNLEVTKNEGIADSSCFSKAEYGDMFEDLWAELRSMELAEHTIDELEESEVFKCSP